MSRLSSESVNQLKLVAGMVVGHTNFRRALTLARSCMDRAEWVESAPGLMVVGPSGCGKTTLAKELKRLYPEHITAEAAALPILYIQTPSEPTIKSLAEAILAALGVDVPGRLTAEQMTRLIIKWVKARRVQMIVFDEVQHFAERKHERVRIAADYFKMLINTAEVPILLLGLESSEKLLDTNEQLRRRFASRVRLDRFRFKLPKQQVTFRNFLVAIQKNAGLQLECDLEDMAVVQRFYWASAGLPAHVMNLLLGGAESAFRESRSLVMLTDFGTAFVEHVWELGYEDLNPFSPRFIARDLVLPGEPFDYMSNEGPLRRAA